MIQKVEGCCNDCGVFRIQVRIWSLLMYNAKWKHVPAIQLFFDLSLDFWEALQIISCHVGELSLDEFIDGARRDKWVMKMLQMDVNPGDWLNDRRRSANF